MFLQLKGIRKSYGEKDYRVEVLKGIDLQISKGEFAVMLGPSGSGKSTLLNIIGGIDEADEGNIIINDQVLKNLSRKDLEKYRRNHLGYIFQMYNLIPNLTVRENIETGAYLSKDPLDLDPLIKVLGLEDHQHKLPNQLSGGQQQRTSIGRAIVKNPDLLLCDEPTGALDYATSKDIMKLIEAINQTYNTTIIMVTHNDAFKGLADHVIRLRDGQIRENSYNREKIKAEDLEW
ncbi:MAG: ABC transporter ATP-binding protein [Erysipelotrichaceae bacterium]|nr:ABC transporter ATP-binding protein [Erysipelotrichaceae bacterium]